MCACRRSCIWISSVVEQHRKLRTCHSVIVVLLIVVRMTENPQPLLLQQQHQHQQKAESIILLIQRRYGLLVYYSTHTYTALGIDFNPVFGSLVVIVIRLAVRLAGFYGCVMRCDCFAGLLHAMWEVEMPKKCFNLLRWARKNGT